MQLVTCINEICKFLPTFTLLTIWLTFLIVEHTIQASVKEVLKATEAQIARNWDP